MYKKYLHGIKEISEDMITEKIVNYDINNLKLGQVLKRSTRVSLTIRRVPKVLKNLFGIK